MPPMISGDCGCVQPLAEVAQRAHMRVERVEVQCHRRDVGVEVGQIPVCGSLLSAREQPAGPVHPALPDVEVTAHQPGQPELGGLHRRGGGVGPGELGEHPLGGSAGLLDVTESPRGEREGVEVVDA